MRLIHVLELGKQFNYWYLIPGIAISRNEDIKGIVIYWLRWMLWIRTNKKG